MLVVLTLGFVYLLGNYLQSIVPESAQRVFVYPGAQNVIISITEAEFDVGTDPQTVQDYYFEKLTSDGWRLPTLSDPNFVTYVIDKGYFFTYKVITEAMPGNRTRVKVKLWEIPNR